MFRNVLPLFDVKTLATTPLNRRIFADVRCCFVGANDGRGLGLSDRKKHGAKSKNENDTTRDSDHDVEINWTD